MTCDRCAEPYTDGGCTHGPELCHDCAWECAECMDDRADEWAHELERDNR